MKRQLIATILLCAMTFSGCGSNTDTSTTNDSKETNQSTEASETKAEESSSETSEDVTIIKYWYPWGGESETWDLWRVSEFEKNNPQYKMENTYVPPDAGIKNGKLLAAIASGDVPDLIVSSEANVVYSYAKMGAFEPLDEYLAINPTYDQDRLNPQVTSIMTVNDQTYLIPQNTDVNLLYYRTDLFEEAGLTEPPKTIDEFNAYAEALTVKNSDGTIERIGFIPWIDEGSDPSIWSYMFGANVYDSATNQMNVNSPEVLASLQWQRDYASLYNPEQINTFSSGFGGPFSPDHPFMTGQVAMTVVGNWYINALKIYAPDLEYAVAPIPSPEGVRYGGSTLTMNVGAVPKGAKNIQGAVDFMLFCQEPYILDDNNYNWRSLGIYPDGWDELTLNVEGDDYLPMIEEITVNENSGTFCLSGVSGELIDTLTSIRDQAIYSNSDLQSLLDEADKNLQKEEDLVNEN